MTKTEVKNSSRSKLIEYLVNQYMFDGSTSETMSSNMNTVISTLDEWFAKNNKSWQEDKVNEEYGEATDAFKEWKRNNNEYTRFHVIVEVSDFIAALASFIKRYVESLDKEDLDKESIDISSKLEVIKSIVSKVDISASEVITNIENKFVEIYIGITTYKKIIAGDNKDILCKVIRTLYTDKELKDTKNEKKIVKEIRRMWYAREFTKLFD